VIRLGRAQLLIKEILTTPGSHPWSGYTSWAQLAAEGHPEPEITLDFTSPTAFGFGQKEWGKKVIVLPEPDPVFGSLARSWNNQKVHASQDAAEAGSQAQVRRQSVEETDDISPAPQMDRSWQCE